VSTITSFEELLGLHRRPVAVKFQESAPEGIARINETAASGCVYWKLAAEGRTFYTEASDHFGCPIGAHTHTESPYLMKRQANWKTSSAQWSTFNIFRWRKFRRFPSSQEISESPSTRPFPRRRSSQMWFFFLEMLNK